MEHTKNVIVAIPLYKTTFDDFEQKSLKSTFKHLGDFPIAFIVPESLDISFIENYPFIKNYSIERFSNNFFKSIDSYNLLMLSEEFYNRFSDYKYTLICQTDVFIFSNQLQQWIDKNYDYIGAPWLDSSYNPCYLAYRKIYNKINHFFTGKERYYQHINHVGNGGFSLRKNSVFEKICKKEKENIEKFQSKKEKERYHIEDVFWSLYAAKKYSMNIPKYTEALYFAWDINPKMGLKMSKGVLPFACHGFNKKQMKSFWKKYINKTSK